MGWREDIGNNSDSLPITKAPHFRQEKKRRPELLLERGLELNLRWGGKKTAALRAGWSPGVGENCYAVVAGGDGGELQETLAVITSLFVISDRNDMTAGGAGEGALCAPPERLLPLRAP